MNIANRRQFFTDGGTWVKRAICNGHVAQVLFLSKRGVYGDYKRFRMTAAYIVAGASQIQSMDRLKQGSVNVDSLDCMTEKLLADIRAETVSGGSVRADAQENNFRPFFRVTQNTFFQKSGYPARRIRFF